MLIDSSTWTRINDFLTEVGSAKNDMEFSHRVLHNVHHLVGLDSENVFVALDASGIIPPKTMIGDPAVKNRFQQYYWRLQPVVPDQGVGVSAVDWGKYHSSEYVTDFLIPLNIRYSVGVTIKNTSGSIGIFAFNRSKHSPNFTEKERRIIQVIRPHLTNLYSIYSLLSGQNPTPDADDLASAYHCLTRREAEIAALLCRRYSTTMIETSLFISRLTLYKHIANIFSKMGVSSRDELMEKLLG